MNLLLLVLLITTRRRNHCSCICKASGYFSCILIILPCRKFPPMKLFCLIRGGTDWGDNGIYISLHKHENISTDPNVRNTWNHIVIGFQICYCNQFTCYQYRSQCKSIPGRSKRNESLLFFAYARSFWIDIRERRSRWNIRSFKR